MKIDLEFAELHSPLFFLGKNYGLKLQPVNDPRHRHLELKFDTERNWLEVHDLNEKRHTCVPVTNCGNLTPKDARKGAKIEKMETSVVTAVTPEPQGKITAQVSGPQSHVHAGPGHGKR